MRFYIYLLALMLGVANYFVWGKVIKVAHIPQPITQITESITDTDNTESVTEVHQMAPNQASAYVPILMYHYIRDYTNHDDPLGIGLSVSPAKFDLQLTQLEDAGYQTISLSEFINHQYRTNPIILTFDDGYDDHFTAVLPILQKHHMTGTFFIVRNFIGRPGYMTEDQISQLKRAGMEIGAHTLDHINLATASYLKANQEISGSLVGTSPIFAYPSGKYTAQTLLILGSLHIQAAVTTNPGIATDASPALELPRLRINQQTDVVSLISKELKLAKGTTSTSLSPVTSQTSQSGVK